jgi:RimJ/RimL family protein N-acetyltransferase
MTFTVERIRLEHLEGYHRVADLVARERKYFSFFEAPPIDQVRKYVCDNIAKGLPQFVALEGGEVVGYCEIDRSHFPAHAHSGALDMALLPAYRGHGHGHQLIEVALADAGRLGLTRVGLSVFADNGRAIALYERVGFKREGVLRDAVCIDGNYLDMIMMGYVLWLTPSDWLSS